MLVRECLARGLAVEVLPGPSAVVTALVASGLPAERWRFAGFLPRKEGELRAQLERTGETLVAFESPGRLGATLAVLAEIDPEREVAVCRELTKLHEEVVRGTAREVAERFADGRARRDRAGGRAGGGGAGRGRSAAHRGGRAAGRGRRAAAGGRQVVSGLTGSSRQPARIRG